MVKRKKKTQEQRAVSREKMEHKVDTRTSNLRLIQCVQCFKNNAIVAREQCRACEFNDKDCCTFVKPPKPIVVLPFGSPMRYNRNYFQISSDNLRESSLNYYLVTDILNEVKNIKGYPNYSKLRSNLSQGLYKQEDKAEEEPEMVTALEPFMCLQVDRGQEKLLTSSMKCDILHDRKPYQICEPFERVTGYWEVIWYLYRVYELDGFGDIMINGLPYKIKSQRIGKQEPDLILAQQEDKLIIGRTINV